MVDQSPAPVRIEIDGDSLVTDAEFCATVLAGVNRRTAKRYEREGLPFVMVGGKKYRPLARGCAWPGFECLVDLIGRASHMRSCPHWSR